MTTLHAIRRYRKLLLSQVAQVTGISVRRLAEFEYEGRPLPPAEQAALQAALGFRHQRVRGGLAGDAARSSVSGRSSPRSTELLSALAATATLALALKASPPDLEYEASADVPAVLPGPSGSGHTAIGEAAASFADSDDDALLAALLATAAVAFPTAPAVAPTALPATPTPTPVPSAPTGCPVQVDQGAIVSLDSWNDMAAVEERRLVLAVDGDGNGVAEPASTRGSAVVAAHSGVVAVSRDSWPLGNFVSLTGEGGWRTGYAHLASVAVQSGDHVHEGQLLGYIGNTGRAAGPQLAFQTWHHEENLDPTHMLDCWSGDR